MAFQTINDIPTKAELDELYPITGEHSVDSHRMQTKAILSGNDPRRMLAVVGPCSAYSPDAIQEYSDRLARLAEDLRERLFIIMRLVLVKPRTRGGWEGIMIQPDPTQPPNIREGVMVSRKMMHEVGKKLPLADEMVNTENAQGFDRPLSYTWIGARTSLSPQHRNAGSGLESPLGIKHPTNGSIGHGVDGVYVAQRPHDLYLGGKHEHSSGNPHAHLILRGSEQEPHANYDLASLAKADRLLTDPKSQIVNPAIIVDASHDNSRLNGSKDESLQTAVIDTVMYHLKKGRASYRLVRGFMLESFLKGGSQSLAGKISVDQIEYGQSITDACLSWEDSEMTLRNLADDVDALR